MDTGSHQYLNAVSIVASKPAHIAARHWERTVKQKKLPLSLC